MLSEIWNLFHNTSKTLFFLFILRNYVVTEQSNAFNFNFNYITVLQKHWRLPGEPHTLRRRYKAKESQ